MLKDTSSRSARMKSRRTSMRWNRSTFNQIGIRLQRLSNPLSDMRLERQTSRGLVIPCCRTGVSFTRRHTCRRLNLRLRIRLCRKSSAIGKRGRIRRRIPHSDCNRGTGSFRKYFGSWMPTLRRRWTSAGRTPWIWRRKGMSRLSWNASWQPLSRMRRKVNRRCYLY